MLSILSAAEKTVPVYVVNSAVKLDGKLLEECWQKQTPEENFSDDTGKKLPLATQVMTARSNSAVYFAAKCAIPENENFRAWAVPANQGRGMGKDDCVIFTLFPGSERDAYYAFYVRLCSQYRLINSKDVE